MDGVSLYFSSGTMGVFLMSIDEDGLIEVVIYIPDDLLEEAEVDL